MPPGIPRGSNDAGRRIVGEKTTGKPEWLHHRSDQPVPVSGGHTFSEIVSGSAYTCGLEGTDVYCWGQIVSTSYFTPVLFNPSQPFVSIFAGQWHSCGLSSTGAAYCWGENQFGQIGSSNPGSSTQPVSGGLSFSTLALGSDHTCGITTAGATYCWGHNTSGQLGTATPEQTFTPIAIASDPGFSAITAGQFHTCAVTAAGATYCWGNNYYGQLGRGTFGYASVPVAVAPVVRQLRRCCRGGRSWSDAWSVSCRILKIHTLGRRACWRTFADTAFREPGGARHSLEAQTLWRCSICTVLVSCISWSRRSWDYRTVRTVGPVGQSVREKNMDSVRARRTHPRCKERRQARAL